MKTFIVCLSLILSCSVFSETRIWTLKNGKTLEAELVSLIGGQVSLKTLKGKVKKIPESELSDADITYVELQMPPKLNLSISRTTKQRVFPDSLSDLPTAQYFDFKAVIKQGSSRLYDHELVAELFVIGEENAGDKLILLDYQKEPFRLTDGSKSVFELPSNTIELIEFNMNGQLRGEAYKGYIIVITDSRNEIIASKASRDEWLTILENLRKVPIRKMFDDDGNRCWPSRPKRFY